MSDTFPEDLFAREPAEQEWTVMGIPLEHQDEETFDIAQPVDALVVVKGFDSHGELHFWGMKTANLGNMEARGMADWLLQSVRDA